MVNCGPLLSVTLSHTVHRKCASKYTEVLRVFIAVALFLGCLCLCTGYPCWWPSNSHRVPQHRVIGVIHRHNKSDTFRKLCDKKTLRPQAAIRMNNREKDDNCHTVRCTLFLISCFFYTCWMLLFNIVRGHEAQFKKSFRSRSYVVFPLFFIPQTLHFCLS